MRKIRQQTRQNSLLGVVFIVVVILSVSATGAWGNNCIEVTKDCEDAGRDGVIHFSGTVTNCSETDGHWANNVTVVDDHAGLVLTVEWLDVGESASYSGSYIATESPSTNTVIATATFPYFSGGPVTLTATDSATCEAEEVGQCWLTAGGVKFTPMIEKGPKDNVGGNVYPGCSPLAGDGGSWTHIDHQENLHFHGTDITVLECGNVPGIEPGSESPVTPYNYIEFEGTGTLKGIGGNKDEYPSTVCFFAHAEDRNEPGNEKALGVDGGDDIDRYFMIVYDCDTDEELLRVDDGEGFPRTITGGNFQIHISSCDN